MRFSLDGNRLRRLFEAWSVPLPDRENVLFALRGCRPAKSGRGPSRSVALEVLAPDYRRLRCVMGIWNTRTDEIFAGLGSTVPHRDNVRKAASRRGSMKGRGTNQLEPGFYADLRKGEHLQGKPMGHAALRQAGYRFYRRSPHEPPYTRRDPLYFGNPYDNLHCAWNLRGDLEGFRSSGCLVVAGLPHCPRLPDSGVNRGDWRIFHDWLYGSPQREFPLLLLPADAAAASLARSRPASRLCYGSRGEGVLALQRKLKAAGLYKGRIDGNLGVSTYRAWNRAGLAGNRAAGRGLPVFPVA